MNANQCSITVIEFYLKNSLSGLPGGPGAKTPSILPMKRGWAGPVVRELGHICPN